MDPDFAVNKVYGNYSQFLRSFDIEDFTSSVHFIDEKMVPSYQTMYSSYGSGSTSSSQLFLDQDRLELSKRSRSDVAFFLSPKRHNGSDIRDAHLLSTVSFQRPVNNTTPVKKILQFRPHDIATEDAMKNCNYKLVFELVAGENRKMKSVFNHLCKKWKRLADSPRELCLISPTTQRSVYTHTCEQQTVSQFCQTCDELVVVEYVWEKYITDVELDGKAEYSEREIDSSVLSSASVSYDSVFDHSLSEERELNISLPPLVYIS